MDMHCVMYYKLLKQINVIYLFIILMIKFYDQSVAVEQSWYQSTL